MGWTTPKTWTVDEALTAQKLNEQLRDNMDFLADRPLVKVYKSAAQSLANNTQVVLTFNSEEFDTHAFHDTVTNNSRLTVPVGLAGVYLVIAKCNFAANSTGTRRLELLKNGATGFSGSFRKAAISGISMEVMAQAFGVLAEGDYIEAQAFQDSGGALDTGSGVDGTWLSAVWLGF